MGAPPVVLRNRAYVALIECIPRLSQGCIYPPSVLVWASHRVRRGRGPAKGGPWLAVLGGAAREFLSDVDARSFYVWLRAGRLFDGDLFGPHFFLLVC